MPLDFSPSIGGGGFTSPLPDAPLPVQDAPAEIASPDIRDLRNVPTQLMYRPDGTSELVPTDLVGEAVRSGAFTFGKDQEVYVNEEGVQKVLTGGEAAKFFERARGTTGDTQAYKRQEFDKSLDNATDKIAAFGIGTADGLTLGFGKGLIAKTGGDQVREYLAAQDRVNAGYGTAGEVAGMVAPALFTGGGSLAARGGAGALARGAAVVGAPTALLSEGAGLLGRGAANLATRLGATEGGALARGIAMAGTGAAEGAVYGLGSETSRAMVNNEAITAEKLIAAATHGAVFGGALGGGISALGSGASGLMSRFGRGAKAEASAAERLAAEVNPMAKEGGMLDRLAERVGLSPEKMAAYAEEKAIKSLTGGQGGQKLVRELEAMSPEARARVSKLVLETVPEKLGKPIASKTEMAGVMEAERKAVGERIGGLTKELDATGVKVDRAAIGDRLAAEVEAPMAANRAFAGAEKEVAALRARITEGGDMSFQELHRLRADIDKIGSTIGDTKVRKELLRDVRGVLEDELQKQGTAALPPSAEWAARWNAAKGDYQAAKWAAKASEKSSIAEKANATFGLREMLGAVAGGNAGATAGALVAGAPGAIIGGAGFGLASAFVNNGVRRYGDQLVAKLASDAAKHGTQTAITRGVDAVISTATNKLVGVGQSGAVRGVIGAAGAVGKGAVSAAEKLPARRVAEMAEGERSARERAKRFDAATTTLANFVASGGAPARIATAGLPPATAQAVQGAALKAASWLQTKAPKPVGGDPLRPGVGGIVPPSEQAKFLRYARAVDDPLSVIEDAAKGRLTTEAAEAVRACYPELAGQIAGEIIGKLATKTGDEGLTYKNAIHVGALLGTPTHELLKPKSIAALQAAYRGASASGGPGPAGGGMVSPSPSNLRPMDAATETETATQRMANR